MAPEIPKKKTGYGMPVEVWTMGAISYLLLAGYAPFDRNTREREIEAIFAVDYCSEPEGILEYWSNVSDATREFVHCCPLRHPWLSSEVPHCVEKDEWPTDLPLHSQQRSTREG
ncbi:peripheral plasma membrane protein [Pisolithus albus]|nr:peripheral plasma membrane protein [Pisolithus albus]